MKNKKKALLSGIVAMSMAFALPLSVSAMPSDIREGEEYDENRTWVADQDSVTTIDDDYVATQAANIREYPNGPIIGNLTAGQSYYVVQLTDSGWYMITGFATNAYVYQDYLIPENEYLGNRAGGASDDNTPAATDEVEELDIMMMATADVNMRSTPNGQIVGVLKNGTDIHVTGNVNGRTWYRCEKDGQTVYIYDDYLHPDFPQTMKATHNVNVRTQPTSGSAIVGSLSIGDKVKVSEEVDGWYKFTYNDSGAIGYSYSDYLAAVAN